MESPEFDIKILSDGSFSLDPGAFFGTVPKSIWNRHFSLNTMERVKLALNIPFFMGRRYSFLIDSGIGNNFDPKKAEIFQFTKESDLPQQVGKFSSPEKVDFIIHSHLHFDHAGHSVSMENGKRHFQNARIVAQKEEIHNLRNTNEITRSSYGMTMNRSDSRYLSLIEGSRNIKRGIRVLRTGGHTSGHQVIFVEDGALKIMYPGDLIPTAFHIRPNYITAIDTFPLETLKMKKKIIDKAIRENYVCIFNHDVNIPAGRITGSVSRPEVIPVDI
ncbi:MBL fold metallo-hydrolase [Oxyplasma meridianum]|uniref:MBL fold metallo-hydrolase n=1 Tax=Oxyplasma meridianum TaxID=3073602 RepID=A0AAX4NDX5_9ARCH